MTQALPPEFFDLPEDEDAEEDAVRQAWQEAVDLSRRTHSPAHAERQKALGFNHDQD